MSFEAEILSMLRANSETIGVPAERITETIGAYDGSFNRLVVTWGEMTPDTTHDGLSGQRVQNWLIQIQGRSRAELADIRDALLSLIDMYSSDTVQGSIVTSVSFLGELETDGSDRTVNQFTLSIDTSYQKS